MKFLIWLLFTQSIFLGTSAIGQDGGICEGTECYFAGRSPISHPNEGNWACRNEYKDAELVDPLEQSAFSTVTGLLSDLSGSLTLETLYAPDEEAEPFEQIISFCGGPEDEHLFTFHFGDVNGDDRKDFACHQDNDGLIRWCTDWSSLGKCELFEYSGYCRDPDHTNYFTIGNFISDLGHDTISCMVTDGRFWVSYDSVPGERAYQSNAQGFCTNGRLHINDINNDGTDDFICHTPKNTAPTNTAILSTGNGTLSTEEEEVSNGAWCILETDTFLSGDFNGDNKTDIGCFAKSGGNVYIEIADDSFIFEGSTWWGELGFCVNTQATVIIGDFNADGLDDVGCHHPAKAKIDIMYSAGTIPFFSGVNRTIENFCPRTSDTYMPRVFAERLHEGEGHTIICIRASRPEAGVVGTVHDNLEWKWSSSNEPVTSLTWAGEKYSNARYDTYNCGNEGTKFFDDYMVMYAYGSQHLCTIILDKDPSVGASSYTFSLRTANIGNQAGTSAAGHYGLAFNFQDENNFEYIYVLPHQQNDDSKSCFSHGKVLNGVMNFDHINVCQTTIYHRGWLKMTLKVDYPSGIAKAYLDDALQAEWKMVFGGGRVGACSYNPNQRAIVAFSYFDITPGVLGTNAQPEYLWKTYNCLTNENVVNTDGTFTIKGDESRDWSPSAYCILTAMDATPYNDDYEFSVYLHFSNDINLKQAGLVFNKQNDTHFDVFYLRPYITGGCLVYGYYDDGHQLRNDDTQSCGDPGLHANEWNLLHLTVHHENKQVTLFINGGYVYSWTYYYSRGAVGANTLNGFDNTMLFKDFRLEARNWKSSNCDSRGWYDIVNQQYVMDTKPSPGATYPEDQLCQSVYTGSSLPILGQGYVYVGKMDLQSATGHPGVTFNYQDENNYEFFIVRPQNAVNCFQKGVVEGGVLTTNGDNTQCGDADGVGDGWIDFKLVMDADNSLATAYIDGKFAKEWTTTFTAGNVGGAAFNGFTNTIIYKDIQVGRIDGALNPKNYDTYNCGTGKTLFTEEIEAFANGQEQWPNGHFCQVIAKTVPCPEEYMYFEMDIVSLGATNTEEGHPALIFNWQNENSYEFFYMRTHTATDCFEYGYFDDGAATNPPIDIACSSKGVSVLANSANTYAVEISGTAAGSTVKYYIDRVQMHTFTTHFTRGRVGFGTVNVPSNPDQVKANYFAPEGLYCRPGKPSGLDGDIAVISGKDQLMHGVSIDSGKDLLKPICKVSNDTYESDAAHVVFRVASGSGGDSSLFDLWSNNAVEPAANEGIDPAYFSRSAHASQKLMKSPIIDKAWEHVTEATVTFYKYGNPVASAKFEVSAVSKSQWFTNANLVGSSYLDMGNFSSLLSLQGFKMVDNIQDCSRFQGWMMVSDQGSAGSCAWETAVSGNLPVFFYSTTAKISLGPDLAQADVFTVSVKMDDSAFGGDCVSNCIDMPDGKYASCYACNVYTDCKDGVLKYKSCHHEYEFDYTSRECTESGSTCTGTIATGIYLPDVCDVVACQHGGQCNMASTGWQCTCEDGFEGLNCETNIDECLSNDCKNNATCVDGIAEYSCNCTETWKGELCDDYDYCHDDPCENGGDCVDGDDDYTCNCQNGYSGKDCDEENLCILNNVQCQNGVCIPTNGSCDCQDGYLGDLCDTDDPCKPNPCNTGTCTVQDNLVSIECSCPTHYSGDHCEIYDDCGVGPCQNSGTCTDIGDDFQCNCTDGFVGKDCGTVDRCYSEVTCTNGECQSPGGTCDCETGWTGELCDDVNHCDPDPCNGNGDCVNGENNYTCNCEEEYVGLNCSLENPCVKQPDVCKNNGTCQSDDQANLTCNCKTGFEGDNCQTGPCERQNEPCSTNGDCINLSDGNFRCDCEPAFVGGDCSIDNPCNDNPCSEGEICEANDDGTHSCKDDPNWNVNDRAHGMQGTLEGCVLVILVLMMMMLY